MYLEGALKSIIFPPETISHLYISRLHFFEGPEQFFFLCVMSKGSWPLDMGGKTLQIGDYIHPNSMPALGCCFGQAPFILVRTKDLVEGP